MKTDAGTILDGTCGGVIIAGTVILSPMLAPWYRRWGTTEQEARSALPGDDLVSRPRSEITCALTVRAPVERVWPWLVQIGCQRAGWYSYDLLDNGRVRSAEHILPEHQHLSEGDKILLTPDGKLGYPIVSVEPEKALVLGGTLNTKTGQGVSRGDPLPEAYYSGTNVFVLERTKDGARLIFRQRLDWTSGFANMLMYRGFLEPISAVMARKMLKGIKRRAEAR